MAEQTCNNDYIVRDAEADRILKSARNHKKYSNRRMNYTDYEIFKQRLHHAGLFGYESELADMLEI